MLKNNLSLDDLNFKQIGGWPLEYRLAAAVIIWLIIAGLFYVILLQDLYSGLSNKQSQMENGLERFRDVYLKSSNIDLYYKQMVEIKSSLQQILKNMPDQDKIPLLLEDISQTATGQGLKFELIKPELPIDKKFYFEQPIQMIILGQYHDFGKFAEQISRFPRIVVLDNFVITKNNAVSVGSENLKMEVYAKTYWYTGQEKL